MSLPIYVKQVCYRSNGEDSELLQNVGLWQDGGVWLPNDVWMRARVQTERRKLRRSRICQARAQNGADPYYLQNMYVVCSNFRHCPSCDTGLGLDSARLWLLLPASRLRPSEGDVMVDSLARSQHQHSIWCLDRHRTASRLRLAFIGGCYHHGL
jgi:hypothetical protein